MSWRKDDFSQYNRAGLSKYDIFSNGKVDIIPGKDGKISLEPWGMFKLVKDWIEQTDYYHIKDEQRKQLIELLSKSIAHRL